MLPSDLFVSSFTVFLFAPGIIFTIFRALLWYYDEIKIIILRSYTSPFVIFPKRLSLMKLFGRKLQLILILMCVSVRAPRSHISSIFNCKPRWKKWSVFSWDPKLEYFSPLWFFCQWSISRSWLSSSSWCLFWTQLLFKFIYVLEKEVIIIFEN